MIAPPHGPLIDDESGMPTLTLSRATVALHGLSPAALQTPMLTAEVVRVLEPWLERHAFDLRLPISVHELPDTQGFRLTQ
jgi:hypothetical protein